MDPQMAMGQPPMAAAPQMAAGAPPGAPPPAAPSGPDMGSLLALASMMRAGKGHKTHPKAKARGKK